MLPKTEDVDLHKSESLLARMISRPGNIRESTYSPRLKARSYHKDWSVSIRRHVFCVVPVPARDGVGEINPR